MIGHPDGEKKQLKEHNTPMQCKISTLDLDTTSERSKGEGEKCER